MLQERCVSFTHQHTATFRFDGSIAPDAVLLGDVDNDNDEELAIGNIDGDLLIFRGSHQSEACLRATGLGTISALALGPLFLGSPGQQLIVCSAEGCLHIFDLRENSGTAASTPPLTGKTNGSAAGDEGTAAASAAAEITPMFSLTCPLNITCVAVADVRGHDRPEMVVGTCDGSVHVLRLEFEASRAFSNTDFSASMSSSPELNIRHQPLERADSLNDGKTYLDAAVEGQQHQQQVARRLIGSAGAANEHRFSLESIRSLHGRAVPALHCVRQRSVGDAVTSLCITSGRDVKDPSASAAATVTASTAAAASDAERSPCVVVGLASGNVLVLELRKGPKLLSRVSVAAGGGLPLSDWGWSGGARVTAGFGASAGLFAVCTLDGRVACCSVDDAPVSAPESAAAAAAAAVAAGDAVDMTNGSDSGNRSDSESDSDATSSQVSSVAADEGDCSSSGDAAAVDGAVTRRSWRTLWSHQTAEPFFCLSRLPFATAAELMANANSAQSSASSSSSNSSSNAGQRRRLTPSAAGRRADSDVLAACSWSGATLLLSALDGETAVRYDAAPSIVHPLRAFASGLFAATPGCSEPCLVYAAGEGEVLVHYNLREQISSVDAHAAAAAALYIAELCKDGALDRFTALLEGVLALGSSAPAVSAVTSAAGDDASSTSAVTASQSTVDSTCEDSAVKLLVRALVSSGKSPIEGNDSEAEAARCAGEALKELHALPALTLRDAPNLQRTLAAVAGLEPAAQEAWKLSKAVHLDRLQQSSAVA